jgi:hypothetical protein
MSNNFRKAHGASAIPFREVTTAGERYSHPQRRSRCLFDRQVERT